METSVKGDHSLVVGSLQKDEGSRVGGGQSLIGVRPWPRGNRPEGYGRVPDCGAVHVHRPLSVSFFGVKSVFSATFLGREVVSN